MELDTFPASKSRQAPGSQIFLPTFIKKSDGEFLLLNKSDSFSSNILKMKGTKELHNKRRSDLSGTGGDSWVY